MNIISLFSLIFLSPPSFPQRAIGRGGCLFSGRSSNELTGIKISIKLFPNKRWVCETLTPTQGHLPGERGHWEPVRSQAPWKKHGLQMHWCHSLWRDYFDLLWSFIYCTIHASPAVSLQFSLFFFFATRYLKNMVEDTLWQAINCSNPADVTWRKSAAEGRQHRICWSQGQHNPVRNRDWREASQ